MSGRRTHGAAPPGNTNRDGAAPPLVHDRPARGLARTFAALRHRNFRLYWYGQLISQVGSWMQGIGQTWLVLQLTHSAWQLGLVGALQALPVLLFSLAGGVLADRWPKRRVLLWTRSAAMIQALLLWALVAGGVVQLWHVYTLALLLGLTSCLGKPAGQAFVVELVGREDLPNAVALNSSLLNLTRIVGPGLGGIIIATAGVAALFLLNAVSFVAVLLGLALIDTRALQAQASHRAGARQTSWQSLREGMHYVRGTPAVLLTIVVVGLVLLFGSNFNVVLPLLATQVLRVGAPGYGFLSAATGAGAFLAALWLAWTHRQAGVRGVLIGTLVFGVLEAVFALSRLYALSLVLMACVGGAEIAFATLAITMLQARAPDHLRGRVMGVCILFFDGSVPLGYVLMGWLAASYGASRALLVGALLSLAVVGAGWLWHRRVAEGSAAA